MFGQTMTPSVSWIFTTDDEALTLKIYRALNDIKPLQALGSPLYVQVSNGVVTLRGVVATYLSKAQILKTVQDVPGVKKICDELWV